jgi:hypothetical protein
VRVSCSFVEGRNGVDSRGDVFARAHQRGGLRRLKVNRATRRVGGKFEQVYWNLDNQDIY